LVPVQLAHGEEPKEAVPRAYTAFVDDLIGNDCTDPHSKTKTNGGNGYTRAAALVELSGPCKGGAAPAHASAVSTVLFNPARMNVDVATSGGGVAESGATLETTVTLHGPAKAKRVHVVEGFTVIGPIVVSGADNGGVVYYPCVRVFVAKTVEDAGCTNNIVEQSGELNRTWAVTVAVPAVRGIARLRLFEYFESDATSSLTRPPARLSSLGVRIFPIQRIVERGWTYTAAGRFKPQP
jgi:hypothetical protein